jgi:CheY-like chemotaxis protein
VDEQRLILVVEDDEATRAFLLDNLAADGFRVAGASGAGEALRAIEVRQPSLVVLDLVLEEGSGLVLLDRVRASDGLASRIDPELPVIVLTGRAGEADRMRSFAPGPTITCASRRVICFPRCRAAFAAGRSKHTTGCDRRHGEANARDSSLRRAAGMSGWGPAPRPEPG